MRKSPAGGSIMNSKKTFILIAFIAAILMAFGFQNSSEHKVLFEKAKFTMETKGDLKGAIKLFNEIIKKYPDEREYAAKSQLYIGLCYEKLGLEQAKYAQKAFQKVVDNYPERQQEVAVAKERISALSKALEKIPSKPTFRKIRIPANPGSGGGVLSPDGKNLVFVSEGCIWSVPIHGKVDPDIAGAPVRLTEATETIPVRGGDMLALSADGKWIAFNAGINEKMEIYIIPSSGGEPKKVLINTDRMGWWTDFRLSLSPDGKVLAFSSREKEEQNKGKKNNIFARKSYIYTIPVEGGTAKKLTDAMATQPAFSPDGKKIAYVKRYLSEPGKTQTDVWVMPASGGSPVQVSDCPSGRARSPVWSPDGKMIAFNLDWGDATSKELWIIPVAENGKPLAPPSKIELPLETNHMIAGWTPDNKIGLHLMNPEHNAVYTVPASGGKAVQVSPAGEPENPRWSPDGKRIYFRGVREGYGSNISSVPAGGGEVTIVPFCPDEGISESAPGGGNDISPDGKKLVFSGFIQVTKDNIISYEVDIYTIPIEGGEPIKITKSPGQDRFPCWSPDGKSIAFIRYSDPPKDKTFIMNICMVPAEGGEVRQITSESDKVLWSCIDWSPDGKSIAYFSKDNNIKVIPAEGGEPRVIVHVDELSNFAELAWSPDGKKLAYTCKGKIWVVASDGGEPVEVKTGMSARAAKIGWSPDGKKIAFSHWAGGDHELWLMEDFLSLIKK
jgi:Tol biopolymer transport system component